MASIVADRVAFDVARGCIRRPRNSKALARSDARRMIASAADVIPLCEPQ